MVHHRTTVFETKYLKWPTYRMCPKSGIYDSERNEIWKGCGCFRTTGYCYITGLLLSSCDLHFQCSTVFQSVSLLCVFIPWRRHKFLQYKRKGQNRQFATSCLMNSLIYIALNIAKRFRNNIRQYNCVFQLTSFDANKVLLMRNWWNLCNYSRANPSLNQTFNARPTSKLIYSNVHVSQDSTELRMGIPCNDRTQCEIVEYLEKLVWQQKYMHCLPSACKRTDLRNAKSFFCHWSWLEISIQIWEKI